ncbi:MAG TPA: hypothetical protein PKD72_11670, partial [Gemmatales bacterium]|nr:hypothetical protein [Gemmatales bacterium]
MPKTPFAPKAAATPAPVIPATPVSATVLWLLGVLLLAAVIWAYWPSLLLMQNKWQNDPQYSQGYLVPF